MYIVLKGKVKIEQVKKSYISNSINDYESLKTINEVSQGTEVSRTVAKMM